jgi:type II secretory pathway pseudopilin PulG
MIVRHAKSSRNVTGFTLVEAAISTVIVGLLLVSSLRAVSALSVSQRIQMERGQGQALAQRLLTEVAQCYFQDPAAPASALGPDNPAETSPAAFDDVDDYNNWQSSPPVLKDGTVLTEYTGWTQSVRVEYVLPASPATVSGTPTSLKRITVTVTAPSGKKLTMVALRSQWGAYEQIPGQPTRYLTSVGVQMQSGSLPKSIYTAAHPMNVTSSQ